MTSTIAIFRAAALCLLAGAAHASTVPAAQADAPVPATRHQPTAYRAPAAQDAAPDRAWRDQNRIVAGYNSMMLTMGGDQHAQHQAPQAAADPHAGHKMPAAAAPDPHAGHHMPKTAAKAGEPAPLLAAAHAAGESKAGCACCKAKDGAEGGSCMAPPAAKPDAGQGAHGAHGGMAHGAGAMKGGCACCKGKDGHAGMAMGESSPAQCMPGAGQGAMTDSGKGGECCKGGGCCKDGCCAGKAAPAPAGGHEGHH
jgi:hypothetical protein